MQLEILIKKLINNDLKIYFSNPHIDKMISFGPNIILTKIAIANILKIFPELINSLLKIFKINSGNKSIKIKIGREIIFINFNDFIDILLISSKSFNLWLEATVLDITWLVPTIGIFKRNAILSEVEKIDTSIGVPNTLTKNSMILGMNTDKTVIFQAFKEKSINESLSKNSFLLNILLADFLDHI